MTTTSRPEWSQKRPSWQTLVSVGVVLLALLAPLRALLYYQGPPMEEGFMLVFPERILAGDVPHVDFLHLYGPGSLWILAAWYKLFGVSIMAERIFGFIQLAAVVFAMMALVRPWGRKVMVASGLMGVLLTMTAIGLTALAWDGAVALVIGAVWVGLRARRWLTPEQVEQNAFSENRAGRLLLVSGALAGAGLLFRPDVIVAVTLGVAAILWGLERKHWIRWAIGAGALLSLYVFHLIWAGPANAIKGMFLEPVFDLRGGRSLPRPPSWDTFDGALQKVALLRPQPWPLPALESPAQAFIWFFLLPAATIFIVGVGVWSLRRSPDKWRARVIFSVGMVGLGLLPQAVQRADTTHLAWVSCVTLTFLPAAISEFIELSPWRRRHLGPGLAMASVALLSLTVIPHFTSRTYLDLVRQSVNGKIFGYPVTYEGRTFYLGASDIAPAAQQMLEDFGPQMSSGDRLFVGTADLRKTPYSDAYLYYLLPHLTPGTRYIEMDPGMANAEGSEMAEEVANSDWLILSHVWDAWDEPNDSRVLGPDEPNEVVRAKFCLVGQYRAQRGGGDSDPVMFEVYRRRAKGAECPSGES
ncbi:MAG: hypothetical protein KDA95_11190 [Acidimicrobiales bacterium]|nr:hypothetical protein [Acidimicrobiales bacterium]